MVALQDMRAHNAALGAGRRGLVALFTGATRGIGFETLRQLVTHLDPPRIYVAGRDAARFADSLAGLRALNAGARIEFIEANVSLLRDVDRVADAVLAAEQRLDLLCMSQGHLPTGGAHYTDEGIDQCFALSYYGRVRLATRLLPVLQKADRPRVLSILAGGDEKRLRLDDIDLRDSYSLFSVMEQLTTLSTLAFARLAGAHPSVSFIHCHPGAVGTDIVSNALASDQPGVLGALSRFAVSTVLLPVLHTFVAMTPRESGERCAFQLTSDRYASADERRAEGWPPLSPDLEVVNGLYLLNSQGEMKANRDLLHTWMTDGSAEKVWDHTTSVLERIKRS